MGILGFLRRVRILNTMRLSNKSQKIKITLAKMCFGEGEIVKIGLVRQPHHFDM